MYSTTGRAGGKDAIDQRQGRQPTFERGPGRTLLLARLALLGRRVSDDSTDSNEILSVSCGGEVAELFLCSRHGV